MSAFGYSFHVLDATRGAAQNQVAQRSMDNGMLWTTTNSASCNGEPMADGQEFATSSIAAIE